MKEKMLVIPSVPNRISEVELYLEKITKKFNIDKDRFPDILISLTEAVNNAIIHGNKKDSGKLVKICMEKSDGKVIFTVTDEGGGFQLENIPDPTAEENIGCCGGRGVYIMTSLCDKISFQNNGSTVQMCFQV